MSNSHCSDCSVARKKVREWVDTAHLHRCLFGYGRLQSSMQSDDMKKGCNGACNLLNILHCAATRFSFPPDHQLHPLV